MRIRLVVLACLAAGMLPAAVASRSLLLGECVGLCVGLALGIWGAEQTRFLRQDGELFYLPHTHTGIAVSALFLGRLVFRLLTYNSAGFAQDLAPATAMQSPVTVAIFFVLIGYYAVYYSVVLYKSKNIDQEDIEPEAGIVS